MRQMTLRTGFMRNLICLVTLAVSLHSGSVVASELLNISTRGFVGTGDDFSSGDSSSAVKNR